MVAITQAISFPGRVPIMYSTFGLIRHQAKTDVDCVNDRVPWGVAKASRLVPTADRWNLPRLCNYYSLTADCHPLGVGASVLAMGRWSMGEPEGRGGQLGALWVEITGAHFSPAEGDMVNKCICVYVCMCEFCGDDRRLGKRAWMDFSNWLRDLLPPH